MKTNVVGMEIDTIDKTSVVSFRVTKQTENIIKLCNNKLKQNNTPINRGELVRMAFELLEKKLRTLKLANEEIGNKYLQ